MTDEQAARQIREDQIDILVDVPLHMSGGRPLIFARKPAPIQVSWLGYPAGNGLEAMDGRISDQYLDPPGIENSDDWQEPPVRLPDCFWCYDPLGDPPDVNGLPSLNSGPITFGCLNNFCKVNEIALRLWARVLSAVPDSRLVILCDSASSRQRTLDSLSQFGLSPDRVEFVGRRVRLEYLKRYHGIDIALDTFPYNGHTTSMDSFWMGVPVVSLVGKTAVARAGLSVATNIGLPEWVAESEEGFVKLAVNWSSNRSKLAELRASLRPRMKASPLMNAHRFARNMESAYRTIWQRWCKGDQPCPR
jgi:predicted O-linked N-acetylglucosamine transferase (SPINDLY family)